MSFEALNCYLKNTCGFYFLDFSVEIGTFSCITGFLTKQGRLENRSTLAT